MIAITITESIKDMNGLSESAGSILVRSNYPNEWVNNLGRIFGYTSRTDLHQSDGWYAIVQPTISANQKRGAIYFDEVNEAFTYEVIDKTIEELQQEQISASEAVKQELIAQIQEQAVVSEAQNYDDEEALNNQALYPFWSSDPQQTYTLNQKCQYPVGAEIWLFKINQPQLTTDELYPPNSVGAEALYSRVAYPDEVLPWVQPTGAHNAYAIGDKVTHIGFYWTSNIAANTTEPSDIAAASGWWIKGNAI